MNQLQENEFEKFTRFDDAMPLAPGREKPDVINPDNPHWNSFTALAMWVFSLFLMGVIVYVSIIVYAFFGGISMSEIGEMARVNDVNLIVVNIAAMLPVHLATILVTWLLVSRFGKQPFFETMGWDFGSIKYSFYSYLLIYSGVAVALLVVGNLIALPFGKPENELERILQSSRAALYITAFLATFTAPLVEEVIYRGIMFPAFQRSFGTIPAVGFVTFLFTLIHVPQYYPSVGVILVICVLSLTLTIIRAVTKNLLPSFVVHTVFNGIQAVLLVASPYISSLEATESGFFHF
ncbi:MAG: CPBP family intramembrane metalloprotease [Pyrinomonadaceae bacterium]|nr:CPBP family intramembrane metalloprotease [Pyrinomonadaceae bacterium]